MSTASDPFSGSARSALPLLDNDVLRSFVAIAERGSFTHAAQEVFRSPSALSMQIKNLEQMLDASLFRREHRQVCLTAEGELLLGHARRLLKLNADAVGAFLKPAVTGTVRLGSPDDLAMRVFPQVLGAFARSHPGVQVDVVTGTSRDLSARLAAGTLDVTLATTGHQSGPVDNAELVFVEPLVWAGLRGGLAASRTPLPLAVANLGCAWRAMALSALERSGRDYRIAYSSEHCVGQKAAVLADLAVAPLPAALVGPSMEVLDGAPGLGSIGTYQVVMQHGSADNDPVQALCAHIRRAFTQIMPRHGS